MKVPISRRRHGLAVEVMLTLSLCPGVLFGQTALPLPRQDFQAWASLNAYHPLGENTDFLLGTGVRYSDRMGHLNFRRITSGVVFHWHKFFTFEPYYQYSVIDSFTGLIRHENRLAFATTIGVPWKRWNISDRNRVERRFRQDLRSWRYRNRVELRHPILAFRKHRSVFAWDEVYYSSRVGRWYRNRLALGVGQALGRGVSIDVYYVHQNDGFSHPGDLNGLGMTLRTRF